MQHRTRVNPHRHGGVRMCCRRSAQIDSVHAANAAWVEPKMAATNLLPVRKPTAGRRKTADPRGDGDVRIFVPEIQHVSAPPILLVCNGRMQARRMRRENIGKEEVRSKRRSSDMEQLEEVGSIHLEGNGSFSVRKRKHHRSIPIRFTSKSPRVRQSRAGSIRPDFIPEFHDQPVAAQIPVDRLCRMVNPGRNDKSLSAGRQPSRTLCATI